MASEVGSDAKIGSTALGGYWRQGLAELRAAAPYGDSAIAQSTDYGIPGMATPGEVGAARLEDTSPELGNDSVLQDRLQAVGTDRDDRGQDDRDKGMERE